MEHDGLRESDTEVDLESAETDTRSEEDRSTDSDTSSSMSSGQDLDVQKKTEDRIRKEKQRKTSSKRYPKPPRPPGGPSLDAADMKLVKEISEHVSWVLRLSTQKQTMIHKQKLMGPCSELDFPDQVHTGSEIEFAYTSEDKNVTGMQDRVVNSDSKHVYKVLLAFW
ncbi:hypothetical protein FNV43_RR04386 [Rhamnella rubrinervis]|uniref:Uncharacterized protein n=1 Tax=Rhamnella rubrinervis TaxID=2594499 RepID=A0A8K0HLN7_9ROSA|nr:hypothetical protein FNV43_RR04386 [Rhamnella rubrinervis]